jgi:transcriptional regulator NrdR family protein
MSRVPGSPRCPICGSPTRVADSRSFEGGKYRWRKRVCSRSRCPFVFPTYELYLTAELADFLRDRGYLINVPI